MLKGNAVLFRLLKEHKWSRLRLRIFSNTGLISSHVIRAWADAESRTTSINQVSSIKVHKRRPLLCHYSEWHLICRFSFWQWLTAVSLRACKSRGDTRQNITTQSDSCPNSTMLSTTCEVVAISSDLADCVHRLRHTWGGRWLEWVVSYSIASPPWGLSRQEPNNWAVFVGFKEQNREMSHRAADIHV